MEQDNWREEAEHKIKIMPKVARETRERMMNDLYYFAVIVNKGYMYGDIHKKIFRWLQNYSLFGIDFSQDKSEGHLTTNKLIMLPRAHLKSHIVATWCAWIITRHPEVTILYLSATSELAQTQLFAIKNILAGSTYRRYFPEYIHPQEGKRSKWTNFKILVDHKARIKAGVRDATIATAGLTTNTTGWHADVIVSDDIVVPENAYTEEGREGVVKKTSQFTSIRNAGGFTLACGTRYFPTDIYQTWKDQTYEVYNDLGEIVDKKRVWDIIEEQVEVDNVFLWPRRIQPETGKAYGFDLNTLSRIRGEYEDITQYYAQYYNDPNDPGSERISRDKFQYANRRLLVKEGTSWYYAGKRLNIYAAVDFAYSFSKDADWSAIAVVGVDENRNYFVLDLDRFKTDKTYEYFKHVRELHSKWVFKKLIAETTVAQTVIVRSIKDYLKDEGIVLPVEEYRPSRAEGRKEERIAAALEPLYENLKVWHFEGGWTSVLEDELIKKRPSTDDLKDALAAAVSFAKAPSKTLTSVPEQVGFKRQNMLTRFGGVPFRKGFQ